MFAPLLPLIPKELMSSSRATLFYLHIIYADFTADGKQDCSQHEWDNKKKPSLMFNRNESRKKQYETPKQSAHNPEDP